MELACLCPMKATSVVWQTHTGAHALTVIVKATFVLKPGESSLATAQEPVHDVDRFWANDPRRSVRCPSDRAPYKPCAEVMLVGHAYAPWRQPVRSLIARMKIGEIDKAIEVFGERGFRLHDGKLLEGPRFARAAIGWEKAAGGPETENPIGISFNHAPNADNVLTIPNVQPIGTNLAKRTDRFAPTGFGPIAPTWPSRMKRLGRHAASFRDPGWEQAPMPADFDSRFFLAAPPDQQITAIRPDERIVLENLHPEHTRLVTALPGLRPRAIADRATGEREEVQLVADTLWIDSDRGLCCVVWRGRIGLRHATEAGRVAVWVDGMPMVAQEEAQAQKDMSAIAEDESEALVSMTLVGSAMKEARPALPFVPRQSSALEAKREFPRDTPKRATANDDIDDLMGGTLLTSRSAKPKAALPFEVKHDAEEDLAETIPPVPTASATPFLPAMPPLQPLRFQQAISSGYEEPIAGMRETLVEAEPPKADVAPPAMIGPIAIPPAEAQSALQREEEETAAKESEIVEVAIELPIEQVATIAADLAEGREERGKVLEAHGLSESAWEKSEAQCEDALDEEQGQGKNALQKQYDAAYVKRVEELRGEITVAEYARIVVGLERGNVESVLEGLHIQEPALMPLVRVWAGKMAADMKIGKAAMGMVREMRRT